MNKPHSEGIGAINVSLKDAQTDLLKRMFIWRLTKQVLTKNYFKFNSKQDIEKEGIEMGTRMVPLMQTYSRNTFNKKF